MKCPKCEKVGQKSSVQEHGTFATSMFVKRYWDDDGEKIHNHDPNIYSTSYSCSQGHEWAMSRIGSCGSCDFGGEEWEGGLTDRPKTNAPAKLVDEGA